jgi:cytochrome c5
MKRVSFLLAMFVFAAFVMVSCGGNAPAEEVVAEEAVVEEVVAPVEEVAAVANLENGKVIYDQLCTACHAAGVAGAAKLDDKARWDETAANGMALINEHAIAGYTGKYGVMPAKGGNPNFTDQEVKDAVAYMLDQAGVVVE